MRFLFGESDDGFERLQAFLLATRAGDRVRIEDAVQASGLSARTCRTALEALARVGVLNRETGGQFVRRTLDSAAF